MCTGTANSEMPSALACPSNCSVCHRQSNPNIPSGHHKPLMLTLQCHTFATKPAQELLGQCRLTGTAAGTIGYIGTSPAEFGQSGAISGLGEGRREGEMEQGGGIPAEREAWNRGRSPDPAPIQPAVVCQTCAC